MLTFSHIWVLLLLPLPLLVRLLPPLQQQGQAVRTPFFNELIELSGGEASHGAVTPRQTLSRQVMVTLCWLLLLSALARPQWLEEPVVKESPARDLLLAVDLSASMETRDFAGQDGEKINRLAAVKEVLDEFLSRRQGDRVALIFFGSAPFIQAPFTEDLATCRALLAEAQVGMAGPKTMLGDTIGLAVNMFKESEVEAKTMILLTDGNDSGSKVEPEEAASIAHDRGITIYPVGVGDPEAAGEEKLDEESMERIAATTSGRYYWAGDRQDLAEIYQRIDDLHPHKVDSISFRPRRDLFHWPLALALLLSMALPLSRLLGQGRRKA
ncbi:MAG: VWA domain-containing protein [Thermodesulfobacteriota bacterium]